jgi:hypothetical protein
MFDDEKPRAHDDHAHAPVHCTHALLGITAAPKEGATDEERAQAEAWIAEAEAYFAHFAAPVVIEKDGKPDSLGELCFHCGDYLTGMGAMLLSKGGGFQWGLAHGEGRCGNCGWPARGMHYPKRDDASELLTLSGRVLSYHPDQIEERKPS